MNIDSNSPYIAELRSAIEKTLDFPLETHTDFVILTDKIKLKLHEYISETTIERLWNYSTRRSRNVSTRTLNMLARYIDFYSWKMFCEHCSIPTSDESEICIENGLKTNSLRIGQRLRIEWLPDRILIVEYTGNNSFVVQESINAKIKKGDSFLCPILEIGKPLRADHVQQASKEDSEQDISYIAGKINGITNIKIL